MVDVSIVTETFQEANWNGQAGGWTGGQDQVLIQADGLTKNVTYLQNLINRFSKKSHKHVTNKVRDSQNCLLL